MGFLRCLAEARQAQGAAGPGRVRFRVFADGAEGVLSGEPSRISPSERKTLWREIFGSGLLGFAVPAGIHVPIQQLAPEVWIWGTPAHGTEGLGSSGP